jgi:hypothetical protein
MKRRSRGREVRLTVDPYAITHPCRAGDELSIDARSSVRSIVRDPRGTSIEGEEAKSLWAGRIIGHENLVEVIECGKAVARIKVGD